MAEGAHNPSFEGVWVDGSGCRWRRKGSRGRVVGERRIRSLLRRGDVPLVVWRSFEAARYDDPVSKGAAAEDLRGPKGVMEDVVASEWQDEDGSVLLMLERHC